CAPPPRDLPRFPTRRSSDLERPAAASTGKGPRSLLARAVLFVCVIPLSVAAAFYLLLGTLIYSTAPERTRPSAEIAATGLDGREDRKSTRLNSSHVKISYAV